MTLSQELVFKILKAEVSLDIPGKFEHTNRNCGNMCIFTSPH